MNCPYQEDMGCPYVDTLIMDKTVNCTECEYYVKEETHTSHEMPSQEQIDRWNTFMMGL